MNSHHRNIFSSSLVKFAGLFVILILAIMVPVTLSSLNQVHEIQQHAAGITPSLNPSESPTPIQTLTPTPTGIIISIHNFHFDPETITVPAGTKVTWINNDTIAHTTTSSSSSASWDSGNIEPGQSFSKTFTTANIGVAVYQCTIHPSMMGTIVVVPPLPTPTISISPSPTGTVSPTLTPSPTPTPTPTPNPDEVLLAFTVGLHGVNMGDNVNSSGTGNITPAHPNPNHQTRNITVTLTDPSGNNQHQMSGQVFWNATAVEFKGTLNVGALAAGDYLIKVKSDGFLQRMIPTTIHLTPGQITQLPFTALVNGDINNDNQLDILDYNALVNCFGYKVNNHSSCKTPPSHKSPGSDIDDNGTIDGADYNLLIREFAVQPGQ